MVTKQGSYGDAWMQHLLNKGNPPLLPSSLLDPSGVTLGSHSAASLGVYMSIWLGHSAQRLVRYELDVSVRYSEMR